MFLAIAALIIVATILIIAGATGVFTKSSRIELPVTERPKETKTLTSLFSAIFPFTRILLEKSGLGTRIKRKLDAAHLRLNATEFFNLKILIMVFVTIGAFIAFGRLQPWGIALSLAAGYLAPDIFINRRITKRKSQIVRMLPETVDLLGLCVEGGLDFNTALKWVIEKVPKSPLIEEFSFLLEEIKWGKPRAQALKDMSKRLNVPEISSIVHTLAQSERMGTPVAEAFAILSEDTRLQRFRRGERIALRAPIKILIPLIFCILPVIAIVIGGPIMLNFMQGGLTKGFGP